MRKLFGTDGIRGKANVYPMDAITAFKTGAAIGSHFRQEKKRPEILIGRDTRLSGIMIESALIAGLCAVGAKARLLGVISTPGVAMLVRQSDAVAGIVISASHNPFVDNGIKIFGHSGFKLPDAVELEIEKIILNNHIEDHYVHPHEVGYSEPYELGLDRYADFLIQSMDNCRLDGMKIAIDCGNGASYRVAPLVLTRLGANVEATGITPNGANINKGAGSLHPENLQRLVWQTNADIGIAFDGDADRAIFVDKNADIVDGDQIMAICAKKLNEDGKLAENTLVATVMSNIGLDRAMEKENIKVVRTAVGDRYVAEEMTANGYNFGGEQSGHLIFFDYHTTGDGVLAALQVLGIMADTGKPLSELSGVMTKYPQVLKNLMVSYKRPLEELTIVMETIRGIEEKLGDEGRVLVRYSGTENKARVMVEGLDAEEIEHFAEEIVDTLDKELN